MNARFAWALAVREGRHGLRRVGVFMTSITLGVAALVSIHSFRSDVARSVQERAEELMGANARLSANRAFPDSVEHVLDSLEAAGVGVSRVTRTLSMVVAPSTGTVRLLQVQALSGGFPFFGAVRTDPAGVWGAHLTEGRALADRAVLAQMGVAVGDSLVVGSARVELAGSVDDLPTDVGFQTAIGPRIFISEETLARAGILRFGSIARHQAFLRVDSREDRVAIRDRYGEVFQATRVGYSVAEEQAQNLANGIRFLGRYLALVGLGALLLGGIGVASAVHVYVRERRTGVAVLRCVGATQWTVFLAYLIQAGTLGLLGSGAGVALGVAVQHTLPTLLGELLPVEVSARFSPISAAAGLGIGVWVSLIFALIPLLEVRDVPPLRALRHDFESGATRRDAWRQLAYVSLAASVVALCVLEAPEPADGLVFAAALAVAVGLLALVGVSLTRATRRFFPRRARYPVRQGVSNLFRPRNQTISVTLALGFGAFVVGTVLEVQQSLREDLTVAFGGGRPNLLLFDVQPDQVDGVLAAMPPPARAEARVSPMVPARIAALNGRSVEELRNDTTGRRPQRWALRREYRNSYRAHLGNAERLVEGRWWDGSPGSEDGPAVSADGLARVSLERDLARSLRVGLGDRITWDFGGVRVESVVTSLRVVDWQRFEPNFFAVFEPGAIDDAPQSAMILTRVPGDSALAEYQRTLVGRYPNVSALDISRVQEAIETIFGGVRQAVGFLGLFSAVAGIVVLAGALASSRAQRTREGALLRTLGARRHQVLTVLFAEYLALGTLATLAGLVLAWLAAALVVPRAFEVPYSPHPWTLGAVWVGVTGLTVVVGLVGSRGLLGSPPLAVLREIGE